MRTALLAALSSLAVTLPAHAQLKEQIARIAAEAHGRVGVACSLPGKALDCDLNSSQALPMQSVYKLPISMAMLHRIEQGRFTLEQKVRFLPSDIGAPGEYSPLRDAYPRANVDIPIEDLLRRAIVDSDNVACDILLRILGGPAAADAYVRSLGITGIHIVDEEKTVDQDERLQYRNSAQPRALVELLRRLADRSPLSAEHTSLLLGWMAAAHSGDHRLKGLLPPGTPVADKTGSAGQARPTMNATNDIGLITLPSGQKLAVAVLITDAAAPFPVREHVIAQIAQTIFDAATRR